MSRPLLNLSIVELTELFENSAGELSVNLGLLKELRHRSTPKATALNKRVIAVIAQNASYAVLQSLHFPELEALAIYSDDKPSLRASLIDVLQTRESAKAQRLLEQLGDIVAKPEIANNTELAISSEKAEPRAFATNVLKLSIPQSVPMDVERAFSLFEVSTTANWNEIEGARQRLVAKYRPGVWFDNGSASTALREIADAYAVLANYMKCKI